MKQITTRLCGAWLLSLASGCGLDGSGNVTTIEKEFAEVTQVAVKSGLQVEIAEAPRATLKATGDDNILDELVVSEHAGVLTVALPETVGGVHPTQPIVVQITVQRLDALSASGGVSVDVVDLAHGGVHFEVSGGSTVECGKLPGGASVEVSSSKLHFAELRDSLLAEVSGGSSLSVSAGSGSELELEASGGSELDLRGFVVETAQLELSGGSAAHVAVSDVLRGEVSGGSWLTYVGTPTRDLEVSDGSTVEAAEVAGEP